MRETIIEKLMCATEEIKYNKGFMLAKCMEKYDLNLFDASFTIEELPTFELFKMVDFHTSRDGTFYYNGIEYELIDELITALKKDYKVLVLSVIPFEVEK